MAGKQMNSSANKPAMITRKAERKDLNALLALENRCFSTDRLSRRSFRHFLAAQDAKDNEQPSSSLWLVLASDLPDAEVIAYGLLLFRRGTGLARLYSIAVSPAHQGQGIAGVLLETLEQEAAERHQVFMRLEVRQDNLTAIALYEKRGYRRFGMIKDYYEDGQAALRMEKRLLRGIAATPRNLPYYRQNTDFTCGPSALLMAMRAQDSRVEMTLDEELQIWREATTIFMLSGHGGCSPHGLALSAWRRGFSVDLYVNTEQTPFIDSVRDEAKKQIMTQVHERFMQDIERSDIRLHHEELSTDRLQQHLQDGASVISLISTWRFNRNKIPHWVTLVRADDAFMYLSDPEPDDDLMHTATDNIAVPVTLEDFSAMNRYGRDKLHCSLVLTL